MSGKKWREIFDIISKAGGASEGDWRKLFNESKSFDQLKKGCDLAKKLGEIEWVRRFLGEMTRIARLGDSISQWRAVARLSVTGSPEYDRAVGMAYKLTREKKEKSLHAWRELKNILPGNHPLYSEIKMRVRVLRRREEVA